MNALYAFSYIKCLLLCLRSLDSCGTKMSHTSTNDHIKIRHVSRESILPIQFSFWQKNSEPKLNCTSQCRTSYGTEVGPEKIFWFVRLEVSVFSEDAWLKIRKYRRDKKIKVQTVSTPTLLL